MFYYHVWVRSSRYRGNTALTYAYSKELDIGTLVTVPLRTEHVPGIITDAVERPSFTTKSILYTFDFPPLPLSVLKLISWLHDYYPAPIGVMTNLLVPQLLAKPTTPTVTVSADITTLPAENQPPLTHEQKTALSNMQKPDTYLLHGRTGSGKTRIYTELTNQSLTTGRSVMILSPEIGLTSQLALNFKSLFHSQVVVFHSRLSAKERQKAWLQILTSKTALVVIGPRSVLFSPIQNVGLIVVDESHDQAYKQEQAPYYQSIRVASQLRKIHDARLVLGSATPSITDYYLALKKKKTVIKLDHLAKPQAYRREITIVDLKDRGQFTRAPHLSLALIRSVSESLAKNEQALLYLNRRGTARVALCNQCGWQAICPNCDIPLIYHGDSHLLRCHICGHASAAVINCPDCDNPSISFRSFGTKAIVEEVKRIFPEARTLRFDADNLKADRLESQYHNIVDGNTDILVGTQTLTKGLDLPRLSTLGVILADSSLYMPDYTAQENMYQLLTQVIGRIGRGHVKSHAIIQTYQPNSLLLKATLNNDWDTFYNTEIDERRKYLFPPFCHLLKLTCSRTTPALAEKTARSLAKQLEHADIPIHIEGPAPSFHEKKNGKYLWQLIIKSTERGALLKTIAKLPTSGWTYNIDPADLL